MKIVKRKEKAGNTFREEYDLNGVCEGTGKIPSGMLLLYLLMKDSAVLPQYLALFRDEQEKNRLVVWENGQYGLENDIFAFFDFLSRQKMEGWELKCLYQEQEIGILGHMYRTIISIRYQKGVEMNVLPLLNRVENETYGYHSFDIGVVENMKEMFRLNQRGAIQALTGLQKHPDIYREFMSGCQGKSFIFPMEGQINERGYTAKTLHERFPLSELGAYNYLIYLRESPEEAIKDLEKGLPRK